nr:uncharacterized protein LOC117683540 [Crassostrea gigas]
MDDIKLILKNIDLPNLANNFAEANVNNVDICKSLSDVDLSRLGIATIGDRIRFREELRRISLPSQNNQHNQHEIRALFRPVRGSTSTSGRIKKQKKRRTWTCEFICLSETDAMKVPTREEKLALVKAGLGSKKIQFNADDTEELFQQKLIEEPQKL